MQTTYTYITPRKVKPVEQNKAEELRNILKDYAKPDPSIVQQLPKGGVKLDFVGHADITRILIEIDPYWSWEPCGWTNGRPAIHVENGIATMWGWLTVHGKELLGVGSVKADKVDLDKELIGDFLRNASMRFGISLNLWTKNQWSDLDGDKPAPKPAPRVVPQSKPVEPALDPDLPLTDQQIEAFNKACTEANLNPMTIYRDAEVKFGFGTQKDLNALRKAFTAAKKAKDVG
jgi:hypothetical protein